MTNEKPTVSVVSTAYRPQNWLNIYNRLNETEIVDADFIFVGPNTPQFSLPNNFKFIKSNVKPAQCLEIAYRNSVSDYTLNIADDVIFKESFPLDKLYKKYRSYKTDKIIVSPMYQMDAQLIDPKDLVINRDDPSSPAMPVGSFMSRHVYFELGGIDKNFIAVLYDLDIALRLYSVGGRVVFSNEVTAYEDRVVASAGGSLCIDYESIDKTYLNSIWLKNSNGVLERSKNVESFIEKDITLYSQGPRGRWRGKRFRFYEIILDSPRFFSKLKRGILKPKMYMNYILRLLRIQKQPH